MGFLDDFEEEEGLAEWMPQGNMSFLDSTDQFSSNQVNQQTQGFQPTQLPQVSFGQPQNPFGQQQQFGQAQQVFGQPQQLYNNPQPPPNSCTYPPPPATGQDASGQHTTLSMPPHPQNFAQRRGTTIGAINTDVQRGSPPKSQRRNAVSESAEPQNPLAKASELELQIFHNIVRRVEAQGAYIDRRTLEDPLAIKRLYEIYATADECRQAEKEQEYLRAKRIIDESQRRARSNEIQTAEETWAQDLMAQLSPTRGSDGAAGSGLAGITAEQKAAHERKGRQKACALCREEKRKCDRDERPRGICSMCQKEEGLYPDKYNAAEKCHPQADITEFLEDRGHNVGKAVDPSEGWRAERIRAAIAKAEKKKADKAKKQQQRRGGGQG
ncbi:hypothetical protein PMZ80_009010 [Knufia obscura]|uniref:Zn(2)-C6 fungal-type domain-containing protein n=2 Tax=Knufia TaxID=430999 RepID=A0AAN8F2A7_9EURO|nr:hypothetical protein PMZ80_009010 [Knufia obscura]KAK5955033.1 hypothetical protein OHC33_003712 [Knufia fluminis]